MGSNSKTTTRKYENIVLNRVVELHIAKFYETLNKSYDRRFNMVPSNDIALASLASSG